MGEHSLDLYKKLVEFFGVEIRGASSTYESIRHLMRAFRQGDREAATHSPISSIPNCAAWPAARMRSERSAHTWQPTALVHELYLELAKVRSIVAQSESAEEEHAAFLGVAGHMMKRLLIHHARPLYRNAQHTPITDELIPADCPSDSLQEVEDALSRLEAVNPCLRAMVEMKVFEGLTGDEIAGRLGCSRGTVSNC